MRTFFLWVYVVTLVTHVPFLVAFAGLLERSGAPRPYGIAFAVSALLAYGVRGRIRRGRSDRPMSPLRLHLVEEPYYAHWCACIAALPTFALGALAVQAAHFGGAGAMPLEDVAALSYGAGLLLALWGVFGRRNLVRVRNIEVPIAGLGASFDGYRIAHMSDLHIGGLWPRRRAQRWIRCANALKVDLVALTGDYVTSGTAFHHDIATTLGELRAVDGAVAVMGNHDYFGDGEPLVTLLRERGVTVLRNEHTTIERGTGKLSLAGVDDTWTKRADVDRAVLGRDEALPLVALAHDPRLFPELSAKGAALVLSGHTHWGQIALPFFASRVNLSRLSYRHHAGIYREDEAMLYVSPGLGTTGPPVRLGAPPEIAVLTLRAAKPTSG